MEQRNPLSAFQFCYCGPPMPSTLHQVFSSRSLDQIWGERSSRVGSPVFDLCYDCCGVLSFDFSFVNDRKSNYLQPHLSVVTSQSRNSFLYGRIQGFKQQIFFTSSKLCILLLVSFSSKNDHQLETYITFRVMIPNQIEFYFNKIYEDDCSNLIVCPSILQYPYLCTWVILIS